MASDSKRPIAMDYADIALLSTRNAFSEQLELLNQIKFGDHLAVVKWIDAYLSTMSRFEQILNGIENGGNNLDSQIWKASDVCATLIDRLGYTATKEKQNVFPGDDPELLIRYIAGRFITALRNGERPTHQHPIIGTAIQLHKSTPPPARETTSTSKMREAESSAEPSLEPRGAHHQTLHRPGGRGNGRKAVFARRADYRVTEAGELRPADIALMYAGGMIPRGRRNR